jgi:hypothetical protein
MLLDILIFVVLVLLSMGLANRLCVLYPQTKFEVYGWLIVMHVALSIAYYIYGSLTASDSFAYYFFVADHFRGATWQEYYGVSTLFIEYLGYPFIHYLGFSYTAMMMLFSWFGLMGFYFFYIFLKEQIRFEHVFFGYSLITIILFLPNLHFWSSSFGKGSVSFLGFGLLFYSLNNVRSRFITLVLGAILIYHVRPHILFVVLSAAIIGYVFSTRGVNWAVRFVVLVLSFVSFFYIYEDVLALTGIDDEALLEESVNLTARSKDLMKANSAVDLSTYNFPMKLFTFWFRPLFIDAPNWLGLIVSFENLFYLFLFFKIFRFDFISFFSRSGPVIKTAFISFFGVSAALAQVSANLGLSMRQKSQVMMLVLFVILKFMDEQKWSQVKAAVARKKFKERIKMRLSDLKA